MAVLIIRNRGDLESLLKKRRVFMTRPKMVDVKIELPGLDPKERSYYERHLTQIYKECGCTWGSVSGISFLVVYIGATVKGWLHFQWGLAIVIGLTLFMLSVGLGKLVGLTRASYCHKKLIANLLARKVCV